MGAPGAASRRNSHAPRGAGRGRCVPSLPPLWGHRGAAFVGSRHLGTRGFVPSCHPGGFGGAGIWGHAGIGEGRSGMCPRREVTEPGDNFRERFWGALGVPKRCSPQGVARRGPPGVPPVSPALSPLFPAMTPYRQELEKYRDIDEDKILQELSPEELAQLDAELAEMDPEVGAGTAGGSRWSPGPRGGDTGGVPRTSCCPRGCGSATRPRRAPRDPWTGTRSCSTWRGRRWRPRSARTSCPSPARRKVWGQPGDSVGMAGGQRGDRLGTLRGPGPQGRVYLARPRQRLGCPGRAGPPPAPGTATTAGNVTPGMDTGSATPSSASPGHSVPPSGHIPTSPISPVPGKCHPVPVPPHPVSGPV